MGGPYRLSLLKVSVARENHVDRPLCPLEQNVLDSSDRPVEDVASLHAPKAKVRRDLIVARSSRMELSRDVSHLFVEQSLDQ
jgi:hypothetical protein